MLRRVVATWAVSFCVVTILIAFTIDAPDLFLLQRQHGETQGQVIRELPNSHGMIEVRYRVGSVDYQLPFRPYAQTGPGKVVRVYYSLSNPATAKIAPPS